MVDKLINVLKEKPIIISSKIFYNYRRLNMNEQDLILLMFLLNTNDNIFNPQNIATNLNVDLKVVMESVNNLVSNNLITIETIINVLLYSANELIKTIKNKKIK